MADRTVIEYGEKFEFENRPDSVFYFRDFELHYWGFLPSSNKLISGRHVFNLVFQSETEEPKGEIFTWSVGTGALAPVNLTVNGSEFTFYPYADGQQPVRIVEGHE